MNRILSTIDSISDWSGKFVSIWILVMIGSLIIEVTLRYIFNAPTVWAHELSQHLNGAYAVLAGAFVLRQHRHVRVDLIYERFSLRSRSILDVITYLFFFLFIGTLLAHGWNMAWLSSSVGEFSTSAWHAKVYPLKWTLVIGAFLLLLQGLANFTRSLNIVFRGKELS